MSTAKITSVHHHALIRFLETIDELLGLQLIATTPDITDEVKQLVIQRTRARESKDYAKSDQLRATLEASGIIVRDTPSGVIWEYAA